MPTREYLIAYKQLKKRDQHRHPNQWDLDPLTGEVMDNVVLVVAPPEYPQLADGLEIGAVYEYEDQHWYQIARRSLDGYFFEWCEKLVELITGSALQGGPYCLVDWCNHLSDMVADKVKYPNPKIDGRGPFWELLRYNLRGMTNGPVACAKLVANFDDWDAEIWMSSDDQFYDFYRMMRECFAYGITDGLVHYPKPWLKDDKYLIEPKLGADPNRRW